MAPFLLQYGLLMSLVTTRSRLVLRLKKSSAQEEEEATTLPTLHDFQLFLSLNPLNAELNPIYHLLALLEAHHILHVSRVRVNAF